MSQFVVSQECWNLGLRAGAILLRDISIGPSPNELRMVIDDEARSVSSRFASRAAIRALPEIVCIHDIIRAVGVKPKSHPPSTQKLLEFAWKQGTLPAINNLVDAYNLMSLRTVCSLGAHDVNELTLPVELRLFRGDETFRPLGSDGEQPVRRDEFGYVDGENRVICRLDSLQADFSKVTSATSDALLIIETTTIHDEGQLQEIVAATAATICEFCGGEAETVARPA